MEDSGAEEWRGVTGFEAYYEVSDLGRVRSIRAGALMAAVLDKDGYPRVILRVNGKHATRKVHRLVAEAFHGDKKNMLHCQVDHIDGNRANAAATNLRWVSPGENHYYRRGKPSASKTRLSKLTEDQVRTIRATQMGYGVATELARQFEVPRMAIYDVLRGRTWKGVR